MINTKDVLFAGSIHEGLFAWVSRAIYMPRLPPGKAEEGEFSHNSVKTEVVMSLYKIF